MDVPDARRANLRDLIQRFQTIERLATETGSDPRHLSQIKNGTRNMGHKVAQRFEMKLGLSSGWMSSRDHTPAQGSLELAAIVADLKKLPPSFISHIAEKVTDLVRLWESIPEHMRPVLMQPPRDQESYGQWEANIKALIASEAAKARQRTQQTPPQPPEQ